MLPTSSTFPVVRSFQQKWMRESSVCWMYTWPLRLSGVTVLPFMVILPARNSTRYLLEELRDPDTMLGNRAPDAITKNCWKIRQNQTGKNDKYQGRIPEMLTITSKNYLQFIFYSIMWSNNHQPRHHYYKHVSIYILLNLYIGLKCI